MRWTSERLPNIKRVVDKYKVYERVLARNAAKMRAGGSPCISWINVGILKNGLINQNETKCYCWSTPSSSDSQVSYPDKRHFLCMGTGFLRGYQRYGYNEYVISTTSSVIKSDNITISGNRNSSFVLSSANANEGIIETGPFVLNDFIEFDRFFVNDAVDQGKNEIIYQYSVDGTNWITIPIFNQSHPLANRFGVISNLERGMSIRFRVIFRKRNASMPSARFNSLRFRYKNILNLCDIDPAFDDIRFPAFLASREQQSREVAQGKYGWTTKFPLRWWTLPDSLIQQDALIKFLKGTFKDYIFIVKNVTEYTYGEDLSLLHYGFETEYIRDYTDLLGIVHLLD